MPGFAKQDYVAGTGKVADEVAAMLKIRNPAEQFAALRASHPQAQFLWSIFRDVFHYIAVHSGQRGGLGARHRPCRSVGASAGRWDRSKPWQAGGLGADCEMDSEGHRRRQDDGQRRCPFGSRMAGEGVHGFRDGSFLCQDRQGGTDLDAARVRAPVVPELPAGREGRTSGTTVFRNRSRARLDPPRATRTCSSSRSRPRCTPSAAMCWTACSVPSTRPGQLQGAGDLAARRPIRRGRRFEERAGRIAGRQVR